MSDLGFFGNGIFWTGVIVPWNSQKEQVSGLGWGWRYKVRIMGYHPYTEAELSNEDLPWAHVMLPPGHGTGSANTFKSIRFNPGDTVIGFFLDGADGQHPVIMGAFANSVDAVKDGEKLPFAPFSGYNKYIKEPAKGSLAKSESGDQNAASQETPRTVSPFLITILASAYMLIVKPASIEARMNYDSETQPKEDRLATVLMLTAIIVGLSLAPIDIFHLNLSSSFEGNIKNIGLGIYIFGMLLVMASMNANEFAETTVNIQEERGQKVIDTGIYSMIRHPMYTGFIFFITGVNVWLGTYLSLLFSLIFLTAALRSRIIIEEKTLLNDLEGYEDYCKKVKARLIPFLF